MTKNEYDRAGSAPDSLPSFESYEVRLFAEKNGMSIERARELIERGVPDAIEIAREVRLPRDKRW